MRLHTNYESGALALLREARDDATARHWGIPHLSELVRFMHHPTLHGSRSHREAIEFGLYYASPKLPGDGRRWKNSGNHGASDFLAATHGEHGWLLAHVFALDASARLVGMNGVYDGRDDFNTRTKNEFWLDMSAGPTVASTNNMHS